MSAPYRPITVANHFISKSLRTGVELTPMKVIKLTYIAHGWYLAFQDEPLIMEGVMAWKYGPVIASLYHAFKNYGNGQITSIYYTDRLEEISSDDKRFLDKIWKDYGKLNGVQLSAITHKKDTPWYQTHKIKKSELIPHELIKDHYINKWQMLEEREIVV